MFDTKKLAMNLTQEVKLRGQRHRKPLSPEDQNEKLISLFEKNLKLPDLFLLRFFFFLETRRTTTMYNGVGISTPRGSGSNGHVQTNLAAIKTKKRGVDWKTQPSIKPAAPPTEMVEDEEQIRHGRKRKVEILVMEWAAEKGLLDDEYVFFNVSFSYLLCFSFFFLLFFRFFFFSLSSLLSFSFLLFFLF